MYTGTAYRAEIGALGLLGRTQMRFRHLSGGTVRRFLAVSLFGILFGGASAQAVSFSIYTDRAVWQSVVNVTYTDTFEGLISSGDSLFYPAGYTDSAGITFRGRKTVAAGGTVDDSYALHPGATWPDWGSGDYFWGGFSYSGIAWDCPCTGWFAVTLPGGVYAVGTDIMDNSRLARDYTVQLATSTGNPSFVIQSLANPGRKFVGIIADTAITGLTFTPMGWTTEGVSTNLDNFTLGAVPEPGSLALLGSGLLAVALILRRR